MPFCVLDEVDAALDEANVGRFATALRGLARDDPVHRHHPQSGHHRGGRRAVRRDRRRRRGQPRGLAPPGRRGGRWRATATAARGHRDRAAGRRDRASGVPMIRARRRRPARLLEAGPRAQPAWLRRAAARPAAAAAATTTPGRRSRRRSSAPTWAPSWRCEVVERARARRDLPPELALAGRAASALFAPRDPVPWPRKPSATTPAVILVVGVNGTGKTTTIAKLARPLQDPRRAGAAGGRRHLPGRRHRAAPDLGAAHRRARHRARRRTPTRRPWSGTPWTRPPRAARTWSSWTPPAGCTPRAT